MALTQTDVGDVRIARILFFALLPAALIGAGLALLMLWGLIIGPNSERNPWNGQTPGADPEGKLFAGCIVTFLVLGLCQWAWYGRLGFATQDCVRVKAGWFCSVVLNVIGISGSAFLIWNSLQEHNLLWEFMTVPLITSIFVLLVSTVPLTRDFRRAAG
jgi:hypothetical protein